MRSPNHVLVDMYLALRASLFALMNFSLKSGVLLSLSGMLRLTLSTMMLSTPSQTVVVSSSSRTMSFCLSNILVEDLTSVTVSLMFLNGTSIASV